MLKVTGSRLCAETLKRCLTSIHRSTATRCAPLRCSSCAKLLDLTSRRRRMKTRSCLRLRRSPPFRRGFCTPWIRVRRTRIGKRKLPKRRRARPRDLRRRAYDSRRQNDVRDHPHNRANDSVRRLFSADLTDEKKQRIHGQSASAELFPCRACSRRRHCDFVADLPDPGRCGCSPQRVTVGSPNRCSAGRNSYFVGVLFLRACADRDGSWRTSFADLRRSSDSRLRRGHTWTWFVAIAATELTPGSALGSRVGSKRRLDFTRRALTS